MAKTEPQRRCVACREMKPKRELLRVVRNKDGAAAVDASQKAPGRGAYICKSLSCLEKAEKCRGFERSFRAQIPRDIVLLLREELKDE